MKVVFITSRGGTHPIHEKYAKSVNADFQYIDFKLRWHDIPTTRIKKYISWVYCALVFPKRKEYDIFLVSGQQVMPILMRKFGLLKKKQKLVCLHANEGLYFYKSKKYRFLNRILLSTILKIYDSHICIGEMQQELLLKIIKDPSKIHTIENGIPQTTFDRLQKVNPSLNSQNIMFIGNLYSGWRSWYKGIDLSIQAVINLVRKGHSNLRFYILGQYDAGFYQYYNSTVPSELKENIILVGETENIFKYFSEAALYLHCSRGDAFPTSTIEAISAGVPVIVSKWTGTRGVIEQADPELIADITVESIEATILSFLGKSFAEKERISKKLRKISHGYIEDSHIQNFRRVVNNINLL